MVLETMDAEVVLISAAIAGAFLLAVLFAVVTEVVEAEIVLTFNSLDVFVIYKVLIYCSYLYTGQFHYTDP